MAFRLLNFIIALLTCEWALTCNRPSVEADSQKHVLLVLPHPDDEILIRSIIIRMVEAGNSVSAVYLTRGEGGRDQRWGDRIFSPEEAKQKAVELGRTRSAELKAAGQKYGFENIYELGMPDDPLRDPVTHIPTRDPSQFLGAKSPWRVSEIKNELERIALKEHTNIVITFLPNQPGTHAHHQATATLVERHYSEHRFGPQVEGLYGFYEDPAESGASTTLPLAESRIEFSPELHSQKKGVHRGVEYGRVGTDAAKEYVSQFNGITGREITNWLGNPPEVIATILSPRGLTPMREVLGQVEGMRVFEVKK